MATKVISDSVDAGVVEWRVVLLCGAGFSRSLAEVLGADRRVDLYAILELVDQGCPLHLAARIMTPLEEPPEGS